MGSWGELYDILDVMDWPYRGAFIFFISFSMFAVVNVVTGVFVENALSGAAADKEETIKQALNMKESYVDNVYQAFHEVDNDRSGQVTMSEFQHATMDTRFATFFEALGLDVTDVEGLFALLDADGSGV